MKHAIPSRARRRLLATVPALALVVTGLSATGVANASNTPIATIGADEYYLNLVEPRAKSGLTGQDKVGTTEATAKFYRKNPGGNPVTARELAKLEAKAIKTGQNPRQIKQAKATQEAKLLTILVEYSNTAADDFTGSMVPTAVGDDAASKVCIPGNVQSGPLHNTIPNPTSFDHPDNNSMWVPDFSSEHFNKMLYTKEGITQRVRPDLTGPDGQPGIDISGYTMRNMYEEMSKGAYTVRGQATPWITLPHSEAWYGANRCRFIDGKWEAGRMQDMDGHPDNPAGPGQMATDAVDKLAAENPNFPWADYDIEDQGDRDGDGNVYEPDGVVDHLVLVHAGEDKSGGGGAQGTYAIWAHSSAVALGHPIPGTSLKISNYIVQPEDSGVGVFAHEYGHDLGLPDLYDVVSGGNSDVDFWDLMSSGSHSGPIFQSMPTHMGLWDKWVLGWADPLVLNAGADARDVQLGQSSRTPKGTKDGIKINLPNKVITLANPHSGANMWYSGSDQDWADVKNTREVAVPAAGDARFWMWNNYVVEGDWDYGFVEVSTNGGTNWTELKVFDQDGKVVSTDDDYADPNGRMKDYGNKKYGLTGDSHGWRHDYVSLGAYAGSTVQVRLRYATDAGALERGWFADDFAVTGGGSTTWSDDVEGGAAGWTTTGGTWTDTSGAGWKIDSGTQVKAHYYLAEWRNFDGFDEGLKFGYTTNYSRGAWKVEKVKYNAPGMLVWYRDTTYGNANSVRANLTSLPSYGPKGGLLIVDSHFDPLRRTGAAAAKDPDPRKNMPARMQSSNAAFSLTPTYPVRECFEAAGEPFSSYCTDLAAQPGVSTFTDAKGWATGLEIRGGRLFNRYIDGSVVIPSRDGVPYTTRIVNPDGSPATDLYGVDLGYTILGTGNPGDQGVQYGVTITILRTAKDNSYATVHVTPAQVG